MGVLAAVATGFAVYITAPFVLGAAASTPDLLTDKLIWTKVAVGGMFFILPGLFGAVLSSAIGSILGAPRTLQALSQDGILPARLGRLDPKTGEPMLALYVSGGVALLAVLLGDLNAVAAVVSMFFLTTYGMLNLAAALEAWVKDPSFRPRLRVHFGVSLVGAVGCALVMALISPLAFVIAVVVGIALRSAVYGALSILLNMLPSLVGFGLWGLLYQDIGLAASVVTAMTIGLVVDDTIYFLLMYQQARARGLDPEGAINHVFAVVGVAMLVITVSLTVGFGTLAFSGFEVNRSLGAMTALVILSNLFIDWLMLPPVMRIMENSRAKRSGTTVA